MPDVRDVPIQPRLFVFEAKPWHFSRYPLVRRLAVVDRLGFHLVTSSASSSWPRKSWRRLFTELPEAVADVAAGCDLSAQSRRRHGVYKNFRLGALHIDVQLSVRCVTDDHVVQCTDLLDLADDAVTDRDRDRWRRRT